MFSLYFSVSKYYNIVVHKWQDKICELLRSQYRNNIYLFGKAKSASFAGLSAKIIYMARKNLDKYLNIMNWSIYSKQ